MDWRLEAGVMLPLMMMAMLQQVNRLADLVIRMGAMAVVIVQGDVEQVFGVMQFRNY